MKIVVDTIIIFSSLLNTESKIGDLIFNSEIDFEFFSCNYMKFEILNHWKKLKEISGLSEEQLQVSFMHIISKINFIK